MPTPLQVLILEDSATDAELEVYALKGAGFAPEWRRVQTEAEFVSALRPELDLILADYQLPQFTGAKALQRLQESGLDVPFIIVSGAIGEELAVELMKQGVSDYLQKDRLTRLGQAVRRAVEQRQSRREKARAEQALRDLAQRMEQQARTFDTLLSSVPDQLSLYGLDQRLTYANRSFLGLLGLSLEEAVGRTPRELGLPAELAAKLQEEFAQVLAGKLVRSEAVFTAPSGYSGCFEYFLSPVLSDEQEVVAVASASRDITDRKAAEEALKRERELREIFVSTLSHDLRTPLAAARMSADLLARRNGGGPNAPMLLGRVIENIGRLDGMIQTLLDANLIRAGERLPLKLQPFCLRRAVQDVLDDLTTVHGDRFRLRAPAALEGCWDERFLRRIIENLANNAVKYGDPEAPVTVTVESAGEEVRIHVHNVGEAISAEDQAALFEPFRRAGAGRHSGKQGWGIGLTMVRGAVEAHGGQVRVDSDPQRGTTFTVVLPRNGRPSAEAITA